jgi:hypothetical protein
MPLSSISFPDAFSENEVAELKARHLACRQLILGCQDAVFRFRAQAGLDSESDAVSVRALEIMEGILNSWCETLSVLRTVLGQDYSRNGTQGVSFGMEREIAAEDSRRMMARFARSAFTAAQERERAGS